MGERGGGWEGKGEREDVGRSNGDGHGGDVLVYVCVMVMVGGGGVRGRGVDFWRIPRARRN